MVISTHSSTRPEITVSLVSDLISEQFPKWARLPIRPVESGGWDNRTFHLGEEMSVRLPSAERYASQVQKEQKWLPKLAPHLSIPIQEVLAIGQPSKNYPWNWSVCRWIEGENASTLGIDDLEQFAAQIAQFLNELYKIDAADGPLAGVHNFYRGSPPSVYDTETRAALSQLRDFIDVDAVTGVWEKAISSKWLHKPVWVHGDFSAGNILVKDGQLAAVIDFGSSGVGDPACDLAIAWTFLTKRSRQIFRSHMELDSDTWARARGWAIWKALITLAQAEDKICTDALKYQQVIDRVLEDHRLENSHSP